MPIVVCENCRAKNRVSRFRVLARATCGKCGVFLPEPPWLLVIREVLQYWQWLAGVLAIAVVVVAVVIWQNVDPPRKTAVEPGWAPTYTRQPASQTPTTSVSTAAKPPVPARPVITCVPRSVRSGTSKNYSGRPSRAPLRIATPVGNNYLIKLVQQGTHRVAFIAYIVGGDTKSFMVPLGTYSIFYAQGQIWCGDKEAFGRGSTHLMRLAGEFAFTRELEGYQGHEIELVPQVQGNLQTQEVSDAEFSALVPAETAASTND
jgi:hypothetical protein